MTPLNLGHWRTPAVDYPAVWDHSTEDHPPFVYDGQFWFVAREGFRQAQVRGPFPDKADARAQWQAFWHWHSEMGTVRP